MNKIANPICYLLDTNILLRWAATFTDHFHRSDKRYKNATLRIKSFCEKNRNPIIVPDIVWVEFLSVMLHKDIDVNDDYETTRLRFRNQQAMVQHIEGLIRGSENWDLDWEPDTSPFSDAQELLQDPGLIDRKTFEWMKRSAIKRKQYMPDMDRLKAKILDGMD